MAQAEAHSWEDVLAQRLARIGWGTSLSALFIVVVVVVGNVLIRFFHSATTEILRFLVDQGPIFAAFMGGISSGITYYGWSRIARRRETLDVKAEAKGQAVDQAANFLQRFMNLGCSSRLSFGTFGIALLCCLLTYAPVPLHILGTNAPLTGLTTSTTQSNVPVLSSPTPSVGSTGNPTPGAHPQPTATPTGLPPSIPTSVPGSLVVQSPTTIALGNYCGGSFANATFAFKNNGGTAIFWSVVTPTGFQLQSAATGTLGPDSTQTTTFKGNKANKAISVRWGFTPSDLAFTASVAISCNAPPPGNLDVLTPIVALGNNCATPFSGAEFSFTNNGGTTIYWTVQLPSEFTLAQNDPTTGSLQPFEGDSQNEFFQGIAQNDTIRIFWGFSSGNKPFSQTVTTTCQPIG